MFAGLLPTGLWEHFGRITRIPRPSGQETAIAQHIMSWAERRGFPARRDAAGNLGVFVPESPRGLASPPIALQAHLDMVCAREEDSRADPARGEIRLVRDGEWIKADGSTLGADNGIAIAAMLHLAEAMEAPHGPIDLLFTVEEETTSGGADRLDPTLLRAKTLLNLDSEEDGVLVAGSAGGIWSVLRWAAPQHPIPDGWKSLEVALSGLQGGHSGLDISLHRMNGILGLVRILRAAADIPLCLCALEGGDAFNAIPRQARAVVAYPSEEEAVIRRAIDAAGAELSDQHRDTEPGFSMRLASPPEPPSSGYSLTDTQRLLDTLSVLPNGVLAMDQHIPGLVETSCNVGLVALDGPSVVVHSFARSSVTPALHSVTAAIAAAAHLGGAEFSVVPPEGPCWQLDPDSPALALVQTTYRGLFGEEPRLRADHAFLECALIKKNNPDLDLVSFGPRIQDAHRPGERVHIGSVERFSRLLSEVVGSFGREAQS